MGENISGDEAKRRIKYWCVRGQHIENDSGGVAIHKLEKPRLILDPIPTHAELDRQVNLLIVLSRQVE